MASGRAVRRSQGNQKGTRTHEVTRHRSGGNRHRTAYAHRTFSWCPRRPCPHAHTWTSGSAVALRTRTWSIHIGSESDTTQPVAASARWTRVEPQRPVFHIHSTFHSGTSGTSVGIVPSTASRVAMNAAPPGFASLRSERSRNGAQSTASRSLTSHSTEGAKAAHRSRPGRGAAATAARPRTHGGGGGDGLFQGPPVL